MDGSFQAHDEDEPPPLPQQGTGDGPRDISPASGGSWQTASPAEAAAAAAAVKKEKGRVRFNSRAAETNPHQRSSSTPPAGHGQVLDEPLIPKPGPSILRGTPSQLFQPHPTYSDEQSPDERHDPIEAAAAAQERARLVAARVQRREREREQEERYPTSRISVDSDAVTTTSSHADQIPLQDMGSRQGLNPTPGDEETEDLSQEARKLVRAHTVRYSGKSGQGQGQYHPVENAEASSSTEPPPARTAWEEVNDGNYDGLYSVHAPQEYRGNVLSQLLRLYKQPGAAESSTATNRHVSSGSVGSWAENASTPGTPGSASGGTGATTPNKRKWYEQNRSSETLINLVGASAKLADPKLGEADKDKDKAGGKKRPPMHKRTGSGSRLSTFLQQRDEEQLRITVHIAETLSRQNYIIKLCRALMLFGAPTHRLEEYLSTTANILEIDGQFLYLPGCMIISFDDRSTHTTEVRIVRTAQGIDLGRLKDTHLVYKEVIHDVIGAEDGMAKLDDLMKRRDKFHAWLRVLVFGLTSASAAPFSFGARLIDLPLTFCFGCLVGFLQLIVAPMSMLYSNVLEVSATVLISFLARAFGSINDSNLFCFSAMAQGGIVMLLPGYMVRKSHP